MQTIYIMQTGSHASKSGGRMVIRNIDNLVVCNMPLVDISSVVIGPQSHLSTPLLFALMEKKIPVIYVDRKGNLCGNLGKSRISTPLLLRQIDRFRNEEIRLILAKYIVESKIDAQYDLIRKYSKSLKADLIEDVKVRLKSARKHVETSTTVDAVRGQEGIASKYYFSTWSLLLRDDWSWKGRIKHPALDPVNALLSYAYAFLEKEVRLALLEVGLDERIGVLHSNNGRKDSLVYDMMDLLRQKVSDRFILKIFNQHRMGADDFERLENACFLKDSGRQKWIPMYEAYMTEALQDFGGKTPKQLVLQEVKQFYSLIRTRVGHVA